MLRRGTENGFSGSIPGGGHVQEICGVGARLLWKNLQKNAKKNIISDKIKRIIPNFRPFRTRDVWRPWRVLSRVTSRHHWIIVKMIRESPRTRSFGP